MLPLHEKLLNHVRRSAACVSADVGDAVLLEQFVLHRDESAFAALVDRHGPMVLRLCRRVLADTQAAEDAFQATFLVLARKAASLRPPYSLAAWLYAVARRVALKARGEDLRRRSREQAFLSPNTPDPCRDPLEQISGRELLLLLEVGLQRLPERHRLPIVLCCLEGRTQDEAARHLGCSSGSVKGRLERGRAQLHAWLVRRGLTFGAALLAAEAAQARVTTDLRAGLVHATVPAAVLFAAGGRSGLSTRVIALAETAVQGIVAGKAKMVAVLVLAIGLCTGTGVAACLLAAKGPETGPYTTETQAAPARSERPKEAEDESRKVDLHGDPLPAGAIVRLGTIRFRHPTSFSVGEAFSRDGQTVVAIGERGVIRVFDASTGRVVRDIQLGKLIIRSFALSPTGRLVAVGGFAVENEALPAINSVRLVDLATGMVKRTLVRKGGMDQSALAFTPDGKYLASIGSDGIVRIEQVATGTELLQERLQSGFGARLTFSSDGTMLALGSSRETVSLWKWQSGNPPRAIKVPPSGAYTLSFSRDGKILATGDQGYEGVRLWDVATGKLLKTLGPKEQYDTCQVAFSPDGRYLASTSRHHQRVVLWDPATGKEVRRIGDAILRLNPQSWSSDSAQLAVRSRGGVRIWEVETGKEKPAVPEGHACPTWHVALLADGTAMTGGDDGTVRLWEAQTGKPLRTIRIAEMDVRSAAVSPDRRWLVTSTIVDDHSVSLWDMKTGRLVYRQAGHGRLGGQRAVAFSPDSMQFLSWGDDMYLRIWEVRNGKAVAEHPIRPDGAQNPDADDPLAERHLDSLRSGAFSHDGGLLLVGKREGFFVFDTKTGKQLRKIKYEQGHVVGTTVSPDGKLLLSSAWGRPRKIFLPGGGARSTVESGVIALHDIATGKLVRQLPHALRWAGPVAFSADGKQFAAASFDDESRISFYDTATGTLRASINQVPGRIWSLAFSPDGKRIIAGLEDTTAVIWEIPEKTLRK